MKCSRENTDSYSGLSETVGNIFQLIVQSIAILFGTPGNCLILRVYWTRTLKTSTHVLIMALAWADLTVCVLAVHRIYDKAAEMAGYEVQESHYIIFPLETTAIGTSIMMTAVIAADRYDCICRSHRRFFTHKRGKIAAWAAFVFSLVTNIPAIIPRTSASKQSLELLQLAFPAICFVVALVMIALCYGKVYTTIKKHTKVDVKNATQDCGVSRLAEDCSTRLHESILKNVEQNIPAVAFMSTTFIKKPCPSTDTDFSTMAQSKGASSHEINESTVEKSGKKWATHPQATLTKHVLVSKTTESCRVNGTTDPRPHQGAGRPKPKPDAAVLQRKTTRMLFITSVVFLLTWLPYWIRFAGTFASYSDPVFHMILGQLSVTLFVNNAVNLLIYGLANRRFRKDCKAVLSKIKIF
ncbi:uncharacterized protein LOC119726330 [Patiria miniata]|uniref:G-protein coupled receptors family 1 profile domain-containing protein n=1 Tax=Patiria miniata TaxID=46514 RepID=A0A913ZR98_PATMI|nr:uncharacterized protein LOC119726330 [Patiria miniata]